MAIRAKFTVQSVTQFSYNKDQRAVKLSAVAADGIPENERYHKYTPQGSSLSTHIAVRSTFT